MNDFTFDELKEIKRCLKYLLNGGITPYSLLTVKLDKKVQSMINNYGDDECKEIRDINCIESCPTCGAHHDN